VKGREARISGKKLKNKGDFGQLENPVRTFRSLGAEKQNGTFFVGVPKEGGAIGYRGNAKMRSSGQVGLSIDS